MQVDYCIVKAHEEVFLLDCYFLKSLLLKFCLTNTCIACLTCQACDFPATANSSLW